VLALLVVLVGFGGVDPRAVASESSATGGNVATLTPVAEAGRSFYLESCASCHGKHATGDGPVASSLVTAPPDLTRIAERRGGAFPLAELASVINGEAMVSAHGTRDMPVWGERFAEEEGGDTLTDRLVMGRIRMLLYYLQAVQR
jgi:mono/diheme cytochrome c family protein